MSRPLLEVIAQSAADARAAQDGGADRIELVSRLDADGLTPTGSTLREVLAVGIPTRVMLRPADAFTVSGADRSAVLDAAASLAAAGAEAFVFGYLDAAGGLDLELLAEFDRLGTPWTLHRAFDRVGDPAAAYAQAGGLAHCDTILTGGGVAGIAAGGAAVLASRGGWPAVGGPAWLAGGGLLAELIPELWAAGITGFHAGATVRDSPVGPVVAERVRALRIAVDAAAGA